MEDIIERIGERVATEESVVGRNWKYWLGWLLGILPSMLLFFSAYSKFAQPEPGFAEGLKHLGWDANVMKTLGFVEIGSTLLYLIPQTALIGAVLLAAYLGGAVATHVRIGDPFFAPVLVGVLIWAGLWLREPRLRALTSLKSV